ncbi:MAG: hypothetical protein FD148_2410, partial [Methylocystaceae bacterium]
MRLSAPGGHMDCIESCAQSTRQFHSVVIRPEVHEK